MREAPRPRLWGGVVGQSEDILPSRTYQPSLGPPPLRLLPPPPPSGSLTGLPAALLLICEQLDLSARSVH